MERIEKSFEIHAPVRAVYNQWTQFEEWPQFMDGIEEIRQIDDTHLYWRASVGGKQKEWEAEITEQVPDQTIAWRSTSGAPNGGQVRFQSAGPDRTRVMLAMEYEPETVVEKAGDALGVLSRRVEKTVEDFKEFIEQRGRETGGWRGEVHGDGHAEQHDRSECSRRAQHETPRRGEAHGLPARVAGAAATIRRARRRMGCRTRFVPLGSRFLRHAQPPETAQSAAIGPALRSAANSPASRTKSDPANPSALMEVAPKCSRVRGTASIQRRATSRLYGAD